MYTKRYSPMHYINICTKQMSLQALYGIVAALTQLFSALNISSCSHLACYVHINKSPQLFKETRDEEGGGGRDYCVASMSCSARITIVYNYVLSKLCHPPVPTPSGIKLQRTIHCYPLHAAGAACSHWPLQTDLQRFAWRLGNFDRVGPSPSAACWSFVLD